MVQKSFNPDQCRTALVGSSSVVVIDLETTGLKRHNRIVAAGILIDDTAYTLFTEHHCHISSLGHRITIDELRHTLEPLASRKDLIVVFHNCAFDVGHLVRIGVTINATIHDTQKMLQLYDPDRIGRWLHRTGQRLNNKLKPVLLHLLNKLSPDFPGLAAWKPLEKLSHYLACDLIATRYLYNHLLPRLSRRSQRYFHKMIVPLTPILIGMTELGVAADTTFIREEPQRLQRILDDLSGQHFALTGIHLGNGPKATASLVYDQWMCNTRYPMRLVRQARKENPKENPKEFRKRSVCRDVLMWHRTKSRDAKVCEALALLIDYQTVATYQNKIADLAKHVDVNGVIHSTFSDHQQSGRISSGKPNLQSLPGELSPDKGAKATLITPGYEHVTITARNVLRARDGYTLVGFDVAQADIRILAHVAEAFKENGRRYLHRLRSRSGLARAAKNPLRFRKLMNACRRCLNTAYQGAKDDPPKFQPKHNAGLARDFRDTTGDFYSVAASNMLGRTITKKDKERNKLKSVILGIVNGKGAESLAFELEVPVEEAKGYLKAFRQTYRQEWAFIELMRHKAAVTGSLSTLKGLKRRITAHWWMTHRTIVKLRIEYKRHDMLWVKVLPIRANRHTLTCYVVSAEDTRWGSKNEKLWIYHAKTKQHPGFRLEDEEDYRFFEDDYLSYRLPVRNLSWRLVREVRTAKEAVRYQGFDATARQLINHIFQGGTADVVKLMMLRIQPLLQAFGAHLLLNIHDELVFEVPEDRVARFTSEALPILEQRPTRNFRVPIVVEPKTGKRFGELKPWPRDGWRWLLWRRRFS